MMNITDEQIMYYINLVKSGEKRACAFGTGVFGKGPGFDYFSIYGVKFDYYCDNDSSKWGMVIRDGIKCISIEELSNLKDSIVCFLLVSSSHIEDIFQQLINIGISMIVPYSFEKHINYVVESVLPFDVSKNFIMQKLESSNYKIEIDKNEKIAVYTCITGDYDFIREPEYQSAKCDYFLISDRKPDTLRIYKWIDINTLLPSGIQDNRRKNRYCKLHPHILFANYKYSIYIDGSFLIKGDISNYLERIGEVGIALPKLQYCNDPYDVGALLIISGKNDNRYDKESVITHQILKYFREGMPSGFGASACGIIVREHNNEACIKLMNDWWHEVKTHSYRDQISFPYVLWKNGYQMNSVGLLCDDIRHLTELKMYKHK